MAKKPVGNDRELNKCTYVSFYGLDGAKKELNKIINEALELLNEYGIIDGYRLTYGPVKKYLEEHK